MTREWVESKIKEDYDRADVIKVDIVKYINDCPLYDDDYKKHLFELLEDVYKKPKDLGNKFICAFYKFSKSASDEDVSIWEERYNTLKTSEFVDILQSTNYYYRYLDSNPMNFDGDIVITDPSYFVKERDIEECAMYDENYPKKSDYMTYSKETEYPDYKEDTICGYKYGLSQTYANEMHRYETACSEYEKSHLDDWQKSDCGRHLDVLGINHFITRDTIFGDWTCSVIQTDDESHLGMFGADTGMVTVASLNEVLKYNPNFIDWVDKHKWCATIIRDFKGEVSFVVREDSWIWEDDGSYHKKGEVGTDYCVEVVGSGVDVSTNQPFNFKSMQSAF